MSVGGEDVTSSTLNEKQGSTKREKRQQPQHHRRSILQNVRDAYFLPFLLDSGVFDRNRITGCNISFEGVA